MTVPHDPGKAQPPRWRAPYDGYVVACATDEPPSAADAPREEVEFLRTIARSLGVEHAKPEPATRLVDRHEVASMFGISVKTHKRAA